MHDHTRTLPTKKQYTALDAIYTYSLQHGSAPTLDELAHYLGLARASSAQFRVRALIDAGWVSTDHAPAEGATTPSHNLARTVRLTDRGHKIVTRFIRFYNSTFARGDRHLILDPADLAIAQKIALPFDLLPCRVQDELCIVRFPTTAERNAWAELILDQLP